MSSADAGAPVAPPRNPLGAFGWAAAWLLVAAFGAVVLLTDGGRIFAGEVYGQRTQGLLIFTPLIGLVIGVLVAVRAVRRLPTWRSYVASTTEDQRRRDSDAYYAGEVWKPLIAIAVGLAVLWVGVVVLVIVFLDHLAQNTAGLFAALMLLALWAMGWVAVLIVALRRRAANLRNPARDSL